MQSHYWALSLCGNFHYFAAVYHLLLSYCESQSYIRLVTKLCNFGGTGPGNFGAGTWDSLRSIGVILWIL